VMLARSKTDGQTRYAVKKIADDEVFYREVSNHHKVASTACVSGNGKILRTNGAVRSGGIGYLVMEYGQGGDLAERIVDGAMDEREASNLLWQILEAVDAVHRCGIVHRDIKPENFVFRDPARKDLALTDFGLSMPAGLGAAVDGRQGTFMYMSPESYQGEACPASDMWSVGVIFHILLSRRFPFSTNDDAAFCRMMSSGAYRSDIKQQLDKLSCSPLAADLLRGLLADDPRQRITADQARKHPFFVQHAVSLGSLTTAVMPSMLNHCLR